MTATTAQATANLDAVELLHAEMALIGRTPTHADIWAVMRAGFRPSKFLILANGKPVRFAINRLAARVAARSAGRLHPDAVIEVEYRPTGERAAAAMDGTFEHIEGLYRLSPEFLARIFGDA